MSVRLSGTTTSVLPSPVASPPDWKVVHLETVALDILVIVADGKPQRAWLTFAFDERARTFVGAAVGPVDEPFKELVCLADGQGILRRVAATEPGCVGKAPLARIPGAGNRGYLLTEPVTVCLDCGFGQKAIAGTLTDTGFDVHFANPRRPDWKGRVERIAQAMLGAPEFVVPSRGSVHDPERCRALAAAALVGAASFMRSR